MKFIGRNDEKESLLDALTSSEAELIAVIGRRRVGKTFLIRLSYQKVLKFELIGIQPGTRVQSLN